MADFIFRWIWHAIGIFVVIFLVAVFLIMGKSYDVVDFETRSNQFSERILLYASEDGKLELADFTNEKLKISIGGDEATSETFSLAVELSAVGEDDPPIRTYYAQKTFERHFPTVNLNGDYLLTTATRYVYLDDLETNTEINFYFIYKK